MWMLREVRGEKERLEGEARPGLRGFVGEAWVGQVKEVKVKQVRVKDVSVKEVRMKKER